MLPYARLEHLLYLDANGMGIPMMKHRMVFSIALVLMVSVVLGCGKKDEQTKAPVTTGPVDGGILVVGRSSDSVGLDPAHEDDGESFKVCDSIYDMLVQYKEKSTHVEPGLAESWEQSPDGLVWTFYLRQGVKFHDGTDFDADAVLFSLRRQFDPDHPFHNVGGPYKYWVSLGMDDIIKDIRKADDTTVEIELQQPYAPFLSVLGILPFAIVSPTAVMEKGADFASNPVGTGAFKFSEWLRGDRIVLEANEDYWGGAPRLDRIVFRSIPENATRLLELETGGIHVMDDPNFEDLARIRESQKLVLLEELGMNVAYVAMNTERTPLNNKLVRQAINHAVNKQAIFKQLYESEGQIAKLPLPPNMFGYNDAIQDYPYDPAKAREMLSQAGYPEGFETTISAMTGARPYMPDPTKVAEMLKSDLMAVGVQANIETYEWSTYLSKVENGEHDIALLGWIGDYGDPDNFLTILLSSSGAQKPSASNIAFYIDPEVDQLLQDGVRSTDMSKREGLYMRALERIHEDAPWVPLAHTSQLKPIRKEVQGHSLHPTARQDYRKTWLEQP